VKCYFTVREICTVTRLLCWCTVTSPCLFWAGTPAQPMLLGWVQPCRNQVPIYFGLISAEFPFGSGLTRSKNFLQRIISKNLWFFANLLLHFDQYCFVFLYCKDTNPVLKYLVFVKFFLKKYFVFMHTANTLTLFLRFFI